MSKFQMKSELQTNPTLWMKPKNIKEHQISKETQMTNEPQILKQTQISKETQIMNEPQFLKEH